MAVATRNLTVTKTAYVKASTPNTHYGTNASTAYLISGEHSANDANYLLFGLSSFPSSLQRNKLYCIRIRVYVYLAGGTPRVYSIGDFNANTVTFATMPSVGDYVADFYTYPYTQQWTEFFKPSDVDTSSSGRAANAHALLSGKGFVVTCDQSSSYESLAWYMKPALANGNAVYVEVTYDDAVTIKSKPQFVTTPSSGDVRNARTVSWKLVKDSSDRCANENWTQSSAKFYWRVQNGTWASINVSGSTTSLTIPANTFPPGRTIEYYLQTTDTEGTTAQTSTSTFTTDHSAVTPATYPTGTINPVSAQTFTWTLPGASQSSTTYTQASAKLFWRVSTASTYNQISVSGSTKSVTVPANTFTSGSTIQWYLQATDTLGYTSTSGVMSFSTLDYALNVTTCPTGSNIGTQNAIPFTWTLKNTQGDVPQKSAVLYWRVQGAAEYTAITNSTSTKSISVPANTFPTASTIQWYLSVTASDNTVKTTSAATFTTVTPQIKATQYPSGSKVDTRPATVIKWEFQSAAGNYGARSATFYWRVPGAATYNAIAAAANTAQLTVPANTFPTASTIEWYIAGVDSSGHSSQTTAATFTTVSTQITPTVYPSGSNVYSGADITIKWKLASDAGDYTQKSAVFYWRLTTSEEYTAISVSGNTQQVTIQALTFPTNATVYWYITAVDSGNHSSSTSVQNFKTSTTQITPQSSPTSGYTNPRNPITFSWYFAASGGSIPQGSASLYWRVQGQSNWTQVSASGSTTSVTIPANTFPVASVIEWYIAGSDSSGTSSQSSVYSFSTTASTVYAVVKSPISSGVDGSVPITFQWTLTTADGYPAKRVILQWKLPTEDEQHWHTIIDTTTAITQYTVDGGTFDPGEINWRVRAYNVDNVLGPESRASFICIIAPTITALTASGVPFSVIAWQAGDQQGYQLEIDGVKFGPYPGTEKQFAVPDYLRDGVHVIRLRVLGSVDLWSEWAETSVAIENSPGNPITAQAETGINVTLEWQASDSETDFYVYRDGKLIGRTGNTRFVDRFSLGTHEYVVINRLTDGNYSLSDTLTETTEVQNIYLSSTDGLVDVDILYRIKGDPDPEHTESRETLLNRLAGHDYAALTRSRFREHTISCTAVFLYTEEGKDEAFRKLLGEEIVAKIRDGTCCAGVIESCTRRPKKTYYTAYDFTIRQIEWEDFDESQ